MKALRELLALIGVLFAVGIVAMNYSLLPMRIVTMTGLGRWFGPTLLVMICGTMLVAMVRIVRAMRVG